jgi:hypothetical protein
MRTLRVMPVVALCVVGSACTDTSSDTSSDGEAGDHLTACTPGMAGDLIDFHGRVRYDCPWEATRDRR